MENNNELKGFYLALFILGVVSCILSFIPILGFLLSIAILIITLIIKSKLPNDLPSPKGLKIMFFTSIVKIVHSIFSFIFSILIAILSSIFFTSGIMSLFMMFFSILLIFGIFISYIIGSILVYKEYDEIK